jgi:hypothetical protein
MIEVLGDMWLGNFLPMIAKTNIKPYFDDQ